MAAVGALDGPEAPPAPVELEEREVLPQAPQDAPTERINPPGPAGAVSGGFGAAGADGEEVGGGVAAVGALDGAEPPRRHRSWMLMPKPPRTLPPSELTLQGMLGLSLVDSGRRGLLERR